VLSAVRRGIEALNARYAPETQDRFYLFHRARRWNPSEGVWMGWERKRGKLEEFNRLLRGATDTSFTVQVGNPEPLQRVRYCITLDSDTRLPRDAARELISVIEHPLNRPRYDPRLGRVVEGYGILQPRVSVTMASAAGSLFARLYAGHTGVDPYSTAVSDTYQDLFGEGSFTGKGLYDVDAFTAALEGRVPENAILSHDLFEGLHARCALVSDIEVVDDFPSSVLAHARRQHRWVRGDWQTLLWMLPVVPTRHGLARSTLPLISRWKIFDNLRRSLVAPALVLFLASAWTWMPGSPLLWTLAALAVMGLPADPPGVASGARTAGAAAVLRLHPRRAGGDRDRARRSRPGDDAARVPRLRDAPRDRADAGADGLHPAAAARVGDRRIDRGARGRTDRLAGLAGLPDRDVGRSSRGADRAARGLAAARRGIAAGAALPGDVARLPGRGLVAEPPGGAATPGAGCERKRAAAADRAAHLELLRALRRRGGSLAASRQRAGSSRAADRPSHLADQHRDGTSVDARGL
jgi:hypothetical protein